MYFLTQESDFKLFDLGKQAIYFYASWMPFHKKMISMISKIEEKYNDIYFIAIDVDHFKSLCIRFEINSIPQIIIFDGGKEINRIEGIVLTSAFKAIFNDIYKK